ncbi:MAG: glycosyltransferase family 4 protein [Candidatus Thermoplasmatota archaeon]|nr:glycosyltransferase family 4 protein [Candidatus Thermoplasmatota archaeon]
MIKVAMVLGHDLLIPNEDFRVYREALALINEGYEVTVFCWARRLEKYETKWKTEKDGIKVVRIFEELKGGFFSKVKSFRKALKKLEEKVAEYEPDIVHAHDLEVLDVAVNIKNKLESKIIFDSHEDWPMLEKVQNWFVGKYYERKQKKLIGNIDALLTVSDELAVRLEGGTVLYNSELLETVEKPVLHDRFGLNGIVAGYIGALRKPILEEILEAASKVNALSVLIVGGPPKGQAGYTDMIKELEELAIEKGANAKFTGPLPYSMMNECYAACDILMVGHYVDKRLRDYAIPKKLLDAMAYKVPVIVGPYDARKKIVKRYDCGIVTEDWAEALTTLSNDKSLRKKMGEIGYKAFKMNYTWEAQEQKLLEIYSDLLNKKTDN